MKKLLIPIILLSITAVSISIIHIDNINELKEKPEELQKKYTYQSEITIQSDSTSTSITIPENQNIRQLP